VGGVSLFTQAYHFERFISKLVHLENPQCSLPSHQNMLLSGMFNKAHKIIHCAVFIVLPFVSYLSTSLHTLTSTGLHPV